MKVGFQNAEELHSFLNKGIKLLRRRIAKSLGISLDYCRLKLPEDLEFFCIWVTILVVE